MAGIRTEMASGDFDAAERDYREALSIAVGANNREGVAAYTGNLAELALERIDWPGAEALAREALSLAERLGRLDLIADDCLRLAKSLVRQGKKAEALPHAQHAVDLYVRLRGSELAGGRETLAECES
jgi:tetratricopeptide (TPR) repeat protein